MGCQCTFKSDLSTNNNDFNIDNATIFDSKKLSEKESQIKNDIIIDELEYQIPTNNCENNSDNDSLQLLRMGLYKEINTARKAPWTYIDKVIQYKERIYLNNNHSYIKVNDEININLCKGMVSFDNCIKFLSQTTSKPPFILLEELSLPFQIANPESCMTQAYLMKVLTQKSLELKAKDIEIVNFHYDKCIKDYEFFTMMQIVDDTNSRGQRRMNIFSMQAKYIGITCRLIEDNVFCFYFLFAKNRDK